MRYAASGDLTLSTCGDSLAESHYWLSGINCRNVQRCFALDEFDSLFSVAWMGKISVDSGDRRRSIEINRRTTVCHGYF